MEVAPSPIGQSFPNSDIEKSAQNTIEISNSKESEAELNDLQINDRIRKDFVIKVYGILMSQISVTFLSVFCFHDLIKVLEKERPNLYLLNIICSSILLFATLITLLFSKKYARKSPENYILLSIFTLSEAYSLLCFCSYFDYGIIINALLSTLVIFIGLSIYAWKFSQFRLKSSIIFMTLYIFSVFSLFLIWLPFFSFFYNIIYGFFLAFYLIYDTNLILGKIGAAYIIDDYIIAALNLYVDFVRIFTFILKEMSRQRR